MKPQYLRKEIKIIKVYKPMSSLYISLLKNVLTDYHRVGFEQYVPMNSASKKITARAVKVLDSVLRKNGHAVCRVKSSNEGSRALGGDWPAQADTMIGLKRLDNIEYCISEILKDDIPGDFIETGVWRGGGMYIHGCIIKRGEHYT